MEEGKLKCFDVAYLEQITDELLHYEVEPKMIYRGVPIDDFISLVKRMREAQKKEWEIKSKQACGKELDEHTDIVTHLEREVDEYLKKIGK